MVTTLSAYISYLKSIFIAIISLYVFVLVQSFDYQCSKGHCGNPSLFDDPTKVIHGTTADVARYCNNLPQCKAFQYSVEKRNGVLCSSATNKGVQSGYLTCVKSPGHYNIDIYIDLKEDRGSIIFSKYLNLHVYSRLRLDNLFKLL